jgi:hypothetical protein
MRVPLLLRVPLLPFLVLEADLADHDAAARFVPGLWSPKTTNSPHPFETAGEGYRDLKRLAPILAAIPLFNPSTSCLSQQGIPIPRPVRHNGRVQDLPAAGAFPGVERPDEVEVLLGEHPSFAFRAFHGFVSALGNG